MSVLILDGKKVAQDIKNEIKKTIQKENIHLGLAVVLVGSDPASKIYVNNKKKACKFVGIKSFSYELSEKTSENELLQLIEKLNNDEKINGILVQLPLPKQINEEKIIQAIDPKKDVDCFHPKNIGQLFLGKKFFSPCTPAGIIDILDFYNIDIASKNCVILGRSNIVGKPAALLFLERNATVTICHSRTKDLLSVCRKADILIAAIGKAKFVKKDFVRKNAILIDVGINRLDDGKICGDIDYDDVFSKAGAITPVPGGVGPTTIANLLKNCFKSKDYSKV